MTIANNYYINFTIFFIFFCFTCASVGEPSNSTAIVTPLIKKSLMGIDGHEGLVVKVEYPPGAESKPHKHNANVFVYVLKGTIEMQISGGEIITLKQGMTFYEMPDDIHLISRNKSTKESAKMLVFFVKLDGESSTIPIE